MYISSFEDDLDELLFELVAWLFHVHVSLLISTKDGVQVYHLVF